MTDEELIDLAVRMRAAQEFYFKIRTTQTLIAAKKLESEFDKAAKAHRDPQASLLPA